MSGRYTFLSVITSNCIFYQKASCKAIISKGLLRRHLKLVVFQYHISLFAHHKCGLMKILKWQFDNYIKKNFFYPKKNVSNVADGFNTKFWSHNLFLEKQILINLFFMIFTKDNERQAYDLYPSVKAKSKLPTDLAMVLYSAKWYSNYSRIHGCIVFIWQGEGLQGWPLQTESSSCPMSDEPAPASSKRDTLLSHWVMLFLPLW